MIFTSSPETRGILMMEQRNESHLVTIGLHGCTRIIAILKHQPLGANAKDLKFGCRHDPNKYASFVLLKRPWNAR